MRTILLVLGLLVLVGTAGATYIDPLAYIKADGADNKINFYASQAGTDAKTIAYRISGFYEVA
jgi:hypothetical protein